MASGGVGDSGALEITLGNVDNVDVVDNMSGAFQNSFNLTQATTVTINGFEDGTDRFSPQDGLTFNQLTITDIAGNALISVTDGGEVLAAVVGVAAADLTAADFPILTRRERRRRKLAAPPEAGVRPCGHGSRWRTKSSRVRCTISARFWFSLLMATNHIVGRVTASQIASASAASFFFRLT